MSEDEIRAWVARQMAAAPERGEAWREAVIADYLAEDPKGLAEAA